jgi:cell division septation protein DedD
VFTSEQQVRQTTDTAAAGATPEAENTIVLVNAEDRIPAGEQPVLPPEDMIAPLNGIMYYVPDEYAYRETAMAETATIAQATGNPLPAGNRLSPFSAPIISSMERGMWYVQVGAFAHPDGAEYEIDRIGTAYPTVIQIIGTESAPVYRVLLGPLSQGESGAILQRFKSIGYSDAFIWSNN